MQGTNIKDPNRKLCEKLKLSENQRYWDSPGLGFIGSIFDIF